MSALGAALQHVVDFLHSQSSRMAGKHAVHRRIQLHVEMVVVDDVTEIVWSELRGGGCRLAGSLRVRGRRHQRSSGDKKPQRGEQCKAHARKMNHGVCDPLTLFRIPFYGTHFDYLHCLSPLRAA